MSRFVAPMLALTLLAGSAPRASAQRGGLPLAPGVHPGSPIGPGMQFLPQPTPRFVPTGPGTGITVMARPNQNFGFGVGPRSFYNSGFGYGGYGGFYGGFGYGGYGYGGYGYPGYGYGYGGYGPDPIFVPVPVLPPQPNIVLANEFPATLTIQLPPGNDMKVNGKPAEDTPSGYTLTSPLLKSGAKYTFAVDVRWTSGGKTYEAKRSVAVGAGERSRLLIVSGEEVKE